MSLERLFRAAHARGLDVLLEHPGRRFRLAVKTTRQRLRDGAAWYRAFVGLREISGSRVDTAAATLADELERAPTRRGESRA